ncbi:hypothetical protein SB861_41970 [Paraburkholderia sp. SIMBA_049]
MRTSSKRATLLLVFAPVLACASSAWAKSACDDEGFRDVRDGQVRKWTESGDVWLEFRTTRDRLLDRYGPGKALQQVAAQAARNAMYVEFDRVVRRTGEDAVLDIRDMQSVAVSCAGEEVFDFRAPWSGLRWGETTLDPNTLMPPIREFLKENGVID